MTLTKNQILTIIFTAILLIALPAAILLSQKMKDIRPKALSAPRSTLNLVGPSQVKQGEKFSVDIILNTLLDPDYTISNVDAVVSISQSAGEKICPPCVYRPMPPDFCKGGKIEYPQVTDSSCRCPPSPICVMTADDKQSTSTDGKSIEEAQANLSYPKPAAISLVSVTPGTIFDNYTYPGSKSIPCGGIADPKCPDGYYCSYGGVELGAELKGLYPDQSGVCVPNDILLPLQGGSGSAETPNSSIVGPICTQDAKQCPDGSWVGRVPPRCEFSPCPGEIIPTEIPNPPPYFGGSQFIISGSKNYAVDENGFFKGFTGKAVFTTLNFIANYSGKVELSLKFIPDETYNAMGADQYGRPPFRSEIRGYRKDQNAKLQSPVNRLLYAPPSLNVEVTGATCIPRPACLDERPACLLAEPPGGWCPPPITPTPNCSLKKIGDANCDSIIDGRDYSVWLNSQCHIIRSTTQCANKNADFNGDGNIDDDDYQIWLDNRGKKQ